MDFTVFPNYNQLSEGHQKKIEIIAIPVSKDIS